MNLGLQDFEGYWLPSRFGFDTRLTQFSSLILSEQMTREEAIEKLKISPYQNMNIEEEFEYIANKLDISIEELKSYHEMPIKSYKDYKNSLWMFNLGARLLKKIELKPLLKDDYNNRSWQWEFICYWKYPKKTKIEFKISSKIEDIVSSDKFILPGVGSFDSTMENLEKSNILNVLNDD